MSRLQAQGSSGRDAGRAHEAGDIDVPGVLLFGIALAAVVIGLVCLVKLLFAWAPGAAAPAPAQPDLRDRSPEPRLETAPRHDLGRFRQAEEGLLGSYGWADRDRRIFRIPIEAAMEKVLRDGFPVRPGSAPGQ